MYAVECYNTIVGGWDVWAKLMLWSSAKAHAEMWRHKYPHLTFRVAPTLSAAYPPPAATLNDSASTPEKKMPT